MLPHLSNSNHRYIEWKNNFFGGMSGIDKRKSGCHKAALLSMREFYKESPELHSQSSLIIENIKEKIIKDISKNKK